MVLPDTSVWVAYLRDGLAGGAAGLDALLREREVVICGPVLAELVAGARPASRASLARALGGLSWAELDRAAWLQVGEAAAGLRAQGKAVALTDIEIAVAAVRAKAALWTRDSDFERIRGVIPDLDLQTFSEGLGS